MRALFLMNWPEAGNFPENWNHIKLIAWYYFVSVNLCRYLRGVVAVFDLVQKPSFYHDLFSLPRSTQRRVSTAVAKINADPFRAGGNAKPILKHLYHNLYRYRIGDYRLVYAVGDRCVALLAIGKRDDVYDRFHATRQDTSPGPVNAASAEPRPVPTTVYDTITLRHDRKASVTMMDDDDHHGFADDGRNDEQFSDFNNGDRNDGDIDDDDHEEENFSKTPALLAELLTLWGVPPEFHGDIMQCHSVDQLLGLDVPDDIKEKLLHWHQPPTIDEILEQPTMELAKPEDLDRYMEGNLKRFLLKLDPEQERVASRTLRGPTLVKGGPGTGKSLVALYRIKNLLEQPTQQQLFDTDRPRILFLTYTRSLINVSHELLTELLGDIPRELDVTNLDRTVRALVISEGSVYAPASSAAKKEALEQALTDFKPPGGLLGRISVRKRLENVRPDYLIEEFDWVIEGRALPDLDSYLREDRTGRGIPFDASLRAAVWALHQQYLNVLRGKNLGTFELYRLQAASIAKQLPEDDRYDVVIIDEAQDLTPAGLRVCVELCKDPAGLYLTADASQSIYSKGFSWQRVHEDLRVRGRTTVLKRNYRSTEQIGEAAVQLLRDHGGGDEEALENEAVRFGPKPIKIGCRSDDEEAQTIATFLRNAARETRLPVGSGAVLVRNGKQAEDIAGRLNRLGIPARRARSDDVSLAAEHVQVMTIHTAKGLEFPFVAVARVNQHVLPYLPRNAEDEEKEERIAAERRLLFVGISRAMRRLLLTYDAARPSPFVAELDERLWVNRLPEHAAPHEPGGDVA